MRLCAGYTTSMNLSKSFPKEFTKCRSLMNQTSINSFSSLSRLRKDSSMWMLSTWVSALRLVSSLLCECKRKALVKHGQAEQKSCPTTRPGKNTSTISATEPQRVFVKSSSMQRISGASLHLRRHSMMVQSKASLSHAHSLFSSCF